MLGKGGARIKQIEGPARKELTEAFGRKVHLFLHVKVNPKWEEIAGFIARSGWTGWSELYQLAPSMKRRGNGPYHRRIEQPQVHPHPLIGRIARGPVGGAAALPAMPGVRVASPWT